MSLTIISIPEESNAPGLASRIATRLGRLVESDLDLDEAVRKGEGSRQVLAGNEAVRAGIERGGWDLAAALDSGVAFDDSTMPQALRRAVMGGVGDGSIHTVVSSSLPCAQAGHSPFRTVLFCDPGLGGAAKAVPRHGVDIPAFKYAQVSEMAGRAGRDRRGEVLVLAPQGDGPEPPRPAAWDGPRRAASALAGRRGEPHPDIATHLLRMTGEPGGATLDGVMSRMSLTWLQASSGRAAVDALAGTIGNILEELVGLGLVARRRDAGDRRRVYDSTELGCRICRSPLPALRAARAVQDLKRSRNTAGEYATQFYLDALRAAWSIIECSPGKPLRGAPRDAPVPPPLARYGWGGQAGVGSVGDGEAGLYHALDHYAFAAAKARGGMSASRLIAAKITAVGIARTLLELADLAHDPDDHAEDISEELACIAMRCILNFFEGGVGLLDRCTAGTERERAAFLIDSLAGRPAGPRWLDRRRRQAPVPDCPAGPENGAEFDRVVPASVGSFFSDSATKGSGEPVLRGGTAGALPPASLHVPALDPPGVTYGHTFVMRARDANLSRDIVLETNASRRGP